MLLAILASLALYEQARQMNALARTERALFQNNWPHTQAAVDHLVIAAYKLLEDPPSHATEFFNSLERLRYFLATTVPSEEAQFSAGPLPNIDSLRATLAEWSARAQNARSPTALRHVAQEVLNRINQLFAEADHQQQQLLATQTTSEQGQWDNLLNSM
jgi:hypothetical protein